MQVSKIQHTLNFGNVIQAQAPSRPDRVMQGGYNTKTILPFDPSENAIGIQAEANGNRTYFYGNALGETTNSTTYHGNNVVKRAKHDTATKHKIEEREYLNDGGVRITRFNKDNGNITQKTEYDRKGFLIEEDIFDPITNARLSNLVHGRMDPICYTYRVFDSKTGNVIVRETRSKDGKKGYKTERQEFPLRKRNN